MAQLRIKNLHDSVWKLFGFQHEAAVADRDHFRAELKRRLGQKTALDIQRHVDIAMGRIPADTVNPKVMARREFYKLLALDKSIEEIKRRIDAAQASLLAACLTNITADSDGMVVSNGFVACQLLGRLGSTASGAIPALQHCLELDGSDYDLVRWLRLMAAEAISEINASPEPALAVATELLDDPEWWLVGHAADLLGDIGSAAEPAITHLKRLLTHDHEHVRRHVRAAIERISS